MVIAWREPQYTGGRDDTFYDIYLDLLSAKANSDPIKNTTYAFANLSPYTIYFIRLVAGNGVSDQDPWANARFASTSAFTLPGGEKQSRGRERVIEQELY